MYLEVLSPRRIISVILTSNYRTIWQEITSRTNENISGCRLWRKRQITFFTAFYPSRYFDRGHLKYTANIALLSIFNIARARVCVCNTIYSAFIFFYVICGYTLYSAPPIIGNQRAKFQPAIFMPDSIPGQNYRYLSKSIPGTAEKSFGAFYRCVARGHHRSA